MKKYAFIDALRGIAILGVLVNHAQRDVEVWGFMGRPTSFSPYIHAVGSQGARGVQLFFLVSAMTLCNSQAQRQWEKHAFLNFFLRRFFRIAPMFYCALMFYTILPAALGRIAWPSAFHVISTVTFLNGWSPYWINVSNAIVPGGWSVAIEMAFYLVFPLLFRTVDSLPKALALYFAALLSSIVLFVNFSARPLAGDADMWRNFCFAWLPNQMPIFALGFVAYFLLTDNAHPGELARPTEIRGVFRGWQGSLWLSVSCLFALPLLPQSDLLSLHLYGLAFMLLTVALGRFPSRIIVNEIVCHIGKISFSGYLVHFFVLNQVNKLLRLLPIGGISSNAYLFLLILFALAGTVALASLTYYWIEIPGQRIGRNVIQRLLSHRIRPAAQEDTAV